MDGIETVGELIAALEDYNPDTPVRGVAPLPAALIIHDLTSGLGGDRTPAGDLSGVAVAAEQRAQSDPHFHPYPISGGRPRHVVGYRRGMSWASELPLEAGPVWRALVVRKVLDRPIQA